MHLRPGGRWGRWVGRWGGVGWAGGAGLCVHGITERSCLMSEDAKDDPSEVRVLMFRTGKAALPTCTYQITLCLG